VALADPNSGKASDLVDEARSRRSYRVAYVRGDTLPRHSGSWPGVASMADRGLVEVLNPVLYPPEDARRRSPPAPAAASSSKRACSPGRRATRPAAGSGRPGLHVPVPLAHRSCGGPSVLDLDATSSLRCGTNASSISCGRSRLRVDPANLGGRGRRARALLVKLPSLRCPSRRFVSFVRSAAGRAAVV